MHIDIADNQSLSRVLKIIQSNIDELKSAWVAEIREATVASMEDVLDQDIRHIDRVGRVLVISVENLLSQEVSDLLQSMFDLLNRVDVFMQGALSGASYMHEYGVGDIDRFSVAASSSSNACGLIGELQQAIFDSKR